jgi:hypothetical protein
MRGSQLLIQGYPLFSIRVQELLIPRRTTLGPENRDVPLVLLAHVWTIHKREGRIGGNGVKHFPVGQEGLLPVRSATKRRKAYSKAGEIREPRAVCSAA